MPKKFKGENSKAAEARARQTAAKEEEKIKKQKQIEDELWRDDDKHVARKQQRKEEKEKKRHEQLEKKKEKEKLYEDEMTSIKSAKPQPVAKVTRAEIDAHREKMAIEAASEKAKQDSMCVTDEPLEENINRLEIDGEEARNIEEAISVLSSSDSAVDRHPEKRLRAAWTAYEQKYLPILKAENPNMRLSQLKQMLKKDWMKSPENPMNQHIL